MTLLLILSLLSVIAMCAVSIACNVISTRAYLKKQSEIDLED